MLRLFWKAQRRERGFTLIELVVVLAILGILIALAVPRYLGSRRSALVVEGDNVLQELKTLAWGYYQQYGTLSVGAGPIPSALGFTAPGSGCWNYDISAAAATTVTMRAQNVGATPARCSPLGAANASSIELTLNSDGSSARSQSLP